MATRRSSGSRLAAGAVRPRLASILLVDDHPPNLMALEAILEPLGERLVRASSGAEAVDIASREDFSLVLLDLQMPELDGLETAALLKKTERSRAVPIIILTANEPTRAMVQKGYASGAVDFLMKPLDPDVLRSKVSVFVDLFKQREQQRLERASPPRTSESPREEPSGRLSERLIAAAPAGDEAETVEALVRIHSALSEDLDVGRIAQRLAGETMSLTGARGGAFYYVARGKIHIAFAGEMKEELRALGPSSALLAPVFHGLGAVRRDDAAGSDRLPPAAASVRSLLAVPVLSPSGDGKVAGALVLVHDQVGCFDTRHEELAAVAARHAEASLENARLYEEAKEARHRAELAELELSASEARLRLALESAGMGTWDYSPLTGILRWDARCKALYGLPPDAEVDYGKFLALTHPEDRARVDAAVKQALDPASPSAFECDYRTTGLDGAERWVSSRGQAIVEHGRPVRFIGTLLDFTAKKRVEHERAALLARERAARADAESARARAEAASRAKDEFLATVSHELRNPLNAILGWSRVLLEEHDLDADRVKKGLDVILRNAKAQVQLVEDILEVSRIVTGKLRLATSVMDVRGVIEAAVDTVRSAAQAKGVLLETRFEDDPGTIVADGDRVQQVLWNLLSNAVKFTPRGGVVSVTARRDADAVELAVEDSGEGIERDFLPFVFDRFRQADGSTTRMHGGLGLGLAIVRHLVELHGGTVEAASQGKGRGATFTVRLPLQATARDAEPNRKARRERERAGRPHAATPLSGARVVVLDDEEDMRDLISIILEDAGAKVTRVGTVDAAMRALEASPPDVAVSDLAMPGEDGYAFVRRVTASRRDDVRRVPLVAMTAYARAEDRHRVLAAGFRRHVAKPIEPAELVLVLTELVRGE